MSLKKLRILAALLFIADIIMYIFITVLYINDLIKLRYHLLIVSLIPAFMPVLSWIFNDKVYCSGPDSRNTTKKQRVKWKKENISLGIYIFVLFLIYFLYVMNTVLLNFIQGGLKLFFIGVFVFAILMVLQLFFLPSEQSERICIAILLSAVSSWCIVTSGCTVLAGEPERYKVEITDTEIIYGLRGSPSYHISAVLKDGQKYELSVSTTVYGKLENRDYAFVYQSEIFGIEIINVQEN